MPMIQFSNSEYQLLARAAETLMKARKNLPAASWKKPQHKAIRGFAKRFNTEPESAGDLARVLDRTDARLIQELASAAVTALKEGILPGYEQRMKEFPDKAEYFKPYMDKAVESLRNYESIVRKVEAIL